MDVIDWFIVVLHLMIGHHKTAIVLGQTDGDLSACLICKYEADPTPARMTAIIEALARAKQQ